MLTSDQQINNHNSKLCGKNMQQWSSRPPRSIRNIGFNAYTCIEQLTVTIRFPALGSGLLLFLKVTYEAIEEESVTGDLVLGGTMPTG